ncbi:PH domain-containing protein [Candidatus Saccharibacteria bacterium]|nr:PH domain-containing protein [Candidatus Saccharibacteria bacterium]
MENYHYPGQPADEVTKRVIYKHIISIVPFLVATVIVGVAVVVGLSYLSMNPNVLPIKFSAGLFSLVGFGVIVMLLLMLVAVVWIWRANKIVVTNQHIVDIDQIGLFNKRVSTLTLSRIQDVSARVRGPLQTVLGYGNINVQTAGEDRNFEFDYVPNPYDLENYILEVHKQFYNQDSGVEEDVAPPRPSKTDSGSAVSNQAISNPITPSSKAGKTNSLQPGEDDFNVAEAAGSQKPPNQT